MYQLLYVSKAAKPMNEQDLLDILTEARENNEQIDVTGILLYKDGRFAQVLEGDEETVQALYGTIKQDPRHTDVTTVFEGDITDREFAEWAMAFADIRQVASEDMTGISMFMEGNFSDDELKASQSRTQAILKIFKGIAN